MEDGQRHWPPRSGAAVEALAVIALALLVRLVAVRTAFDPNLVFEKFFLVARELMADGWLTAEPFAYSPIYVYFLAVLLALGATPAVICGLQVVLGALTCLLLWALARPLFGPAVAVTTGAGAALYAPFLVHDLSFESDSLGLLLFCAFAALVLRAVRQPSLPAFALAGLALGLRLVQRPNVLVLLPLLPIVAYLAVRPRWRVAQLFACWGVLALAASLPVLPVTWQNWRASGELILVTDHPGYALYVGNSRTATGLGYYPPGLARQLMSAPSREGASPLEHMDSAVAREVASVVVGRPLSPREASRFWSAEALRAVRERGTGQILLQLRKLLYLFHDFEAHDNLAALLVEDRLRALGWLGMGALAPLALIGIALAVRQRPRPPELPLLLVLLVVPVVTASLFHVASRFRLDLAAILMPFAALTLVHAVGALRARRWQRVFTLGFSTAALAVPCNLEGGYLQYQEGYRQILVHTARGLAQTDPRLAVFELEQAVSLANAPAEAETAYRRLAELYHGLGDSARATECAHLAQGRLSAGVAAKLRSRPQDSGALYALARHHLLRGEYREAERQLAIAVGIDPGDPELAFGLVWTRFLSGTASPETTLAALDRGLMGDLKLSQEAPAAHRLRARCLIALERWSEAEEALAEARRLDPSSPEAPALLAVVYRATGRELEARAAAEAALELGGGDLSPGAAARN